jgi:hypothetical protein
MVWTLEIRRDEFLAVLRRCTSGVSNRSLQAPVVFSFSGGKLSIEGTGIAAEIPASGEWPGAVTLAALLLRQLIPTFPKDDPLRLQADDHNFTIARFSIPCERRPLSTVGDAGSSAESKSQASSVAEKSEAAWPARYVAAHDKKLQQILERAASILKPYRVSEVDLKSLVERHIADGVNPCAETENPVIKRIAEAWILLAPLGIEPNEIKTLIDDGIKNAWKRPK